MWSLWTEWNEAGGESHIFSSPQTSILWHIIWRCIRYDNVWYDFVGWIIWNFVGCWKDRYGLIWKHAQWKRCVRVRIGSRRESGEKKLFLFMFKAISYDGKELWQAYKTAYLFCGEGCTEMENVYSHQTYLLYKNPQVYTTIELT